MQGGHSFGLPVFSRKTLDHAGVGLNFVIRLCRRHAVGEAGIITVQT